MIIAIDGFSSCGKSTLARDLAQHLNMIFIDSGAMYRAVTFYLIQHKIDIDDIENIKKALTDINIKFLDSGIVLNGKDVSTAIRLPVVADLVSQVAALSPVRKKLVKMQKDFGHSNNIVMDGRDIGSVVFPNADYKFFVKADLEVRAERRFLELKQRGTSLDIDEVVTNLRQRDHIDSTRSDSPLIQTHNAIVIDTTNLTRKSQLETVLSHIISNENK